MSGLEICLLLIGAVLIGASFLVGEKLNNKEGDIYTDADITKLSEDEVAKILEAELQRQIDDKVEKTEANLDKITTEKIMAVGNYSSNVIENIEKNHKEVMFLYNMLNDKEEVIKDTVKDIEALKQSIKRMNSETVVKPLKGEDNIKIQENAIEVQEQLKEQVADIMMSENTTEETVTDEETESESIREPEKEQQMQNIKGLTGSNDSKITTIAGAQKDNNNNQKILELHNQGKNNIEIAKELGLGLGEVRLVIDLYNSKK